jgi:hypothetical protein
MYLLLAALTTATTVSAQSNARPEILIVGTYHMANPGHDINSTHADDVLAPKRQQDIAELLDVLKTFHPTKIAIESGTNGPRPAQYAAFLAGKYTLTANEIDQLGFRLAKELGHQTVYPVDADGDFPYYRVQNYAKANGRVQEFDAIQAASAERSKALDAFIQSHTVLQTLAYMNSDSTVAQDVAWYFEMVRFGEPFEPAGPDLLASWYQRNIRIYRNIVTLSQSPNERILVIYGSGHLGWLRQDAANDPAVRLLKLSEFIRRE